MPKEKYNRLKEILVREGKSQIWLAEELGKHPNTIANMCNNKTQPHLKDLYVIADLLNIEVCELLVPKKTNR